MFILYVCFRISQIKLYFWSITSYIFCIKAVFPAHSIEIPAKFLIFINLAVNTASLNPQRRSITKGELLKVISMILSHQQKIAACILVLYWPVLFVLAHIPIPHVVQEVEVSDKSLHFLAYLILTFLIWSVVGGDRKVKWRRAAPWLVLLFIAVYGVLDEWLQSYVAGRSADIRDYFADMTGVITSLILYSFFPFWPAGLLITAIFIFAVTIVAQENLAELLPVTDAVFHLVSYAILTVIWIQCMYHFPAVKTSKARWLILALAGPAGFLIIIKLFSLIAGKDFTLSDIIISCGAIAAVVAGFYLGALFGKVRDAKNPNTGL
jgi:VanZ family protein